jgi:hypothetical protein
MAFETREEVLEKILEMPKPCCPQCGVEMNIWEVPPINFSDGLGWGEPFLFICFNDACPSFVNGWDHIGEHYAHRASYRCINYPGSQTFEFMPVFSSQGATGQIIDEEAVAREEALKASIKKGFNLLATCYVDKDGPTILGILLDATEPARVRMKAAEMLGDIGELEVIEPLRSLRVGNTLIQEKVSAAVARIHERFFTRECPFCAEIIKQRAKLCKHCGQTVAGE